MQLTLMCQDLEVAAFDLDLVTGQASNVRPLAHAARAPLSVRLAGPEAAADLTRFVARRALPPGRPDRDRILAATRSESAVALALRAHGLSLSDPYWYRKPHDTASWQELNFFEHTWDPAFGEAVLACDEAALAMASCRVPDATCAGFAPKAWVRTDAGLRLLKGALAGGVGADPVGEVAASRLAARILPQGAFVSYELVRHQGKTFSCCGLMTGPDEELVSLRALVHEKSDPHAMGRPSPVWDQEQVARYCAALESAGISAPLRHASQLAVLATLAMQGDQHLGNCGIAHNVRTGEVRVAPLFDFGGSFGTAVSAQGMRAVVARPRLVERFVCSRLRRLDPSWDYSWYDPRALEGFERELEQLLRQDGRLPPTYVATVVEVFGRQRAYLENVVSNA